MARDRPPAAPPSYVVDISMLGRHVLPFLYLRNKDVSMKSAVRALDLGSSVAEFDDSLEKYFIENEAFHALVGGKIDIVAGDKGTGKTALYRILKKRYTTLEKLKGIEVLAGFNPAGNPVFQRLTTEEPLTEGQYVSVWKAYTLSLVGNWLLDIVGEDHSGKMAELAKMLSETGLRSKDDKPETVFSKIVNGLQAVLRPQTAEIGLTVSETGIPIVTPKLTFFGDSAKQDATVKQVPHEIALRLLNDCLGEIDYSVWIVLDRLDEAFQGFPAVEVPALRTLFRTYLDLLDFDRMRLKLFVRRDLFRRIIGDGFVNLTHVNARKIEISWDEKDLLNLLCRRVRDSSEITAMLGAEKLSDDDLFYRLFPGKVEQATRKPTSWNWIMARIRDGNDIKPPRNLIDLVKMARDAQLKAEERSPRQFSNDNPLIEAESLKKALEKLSEQRVEDTLLAEAGPLLSTMIQKFRRAKAEQNIDSLGGRIRPSHP
ncbi:hypothetical protein LC55x_1649 [Lysobacter capsici]|uniref:P-loop ATPase, Sll1717 family n=1 Tax=Lysobacter capsici TaxID=435897 RepID=UPI00072098EB|nr:hypothetical protein [Lysobacter capsici]ALN84939.1 hypothetical protein LC55x_1649 [Lysobacter capsici]